MSNEEQHINPWAAKLQQAPLPDADVSWKGMERLLDQQLPVQEEKKKRRFPFFFLIITLLLGVGAVLLYQGRHVHKEIEKQVGLPHFESSSTTDKQRTQEAESQQTIQEEQGTTNLINKVAMASDSMTRQRSHTITTASDIITDQNTAAVDSSAPTKEQERLNTIGEKINTPIKTPAAGKETIKENRVSTTAMQGVKPGKLVIYRSSKAKRKRLLQVSVANKMKHDLSQEENNSTATIGTQKGIRKHSNQQSQTGSNARTDIPSAPASVSIGKADAASSKEVLVEKVNSVSSLPAYRSTTKLLSTTIDSLNIQKHSTLLDNILTQLKKGKPEVIRRGWTFGVGVNQFFRISQQQPAIYKTNAQDFSSDALTGRLADYIPIAQARYHFNNKLAIQGELQFNAPQFTQRVLLDYNNYQQGNFSAVDSAFLRKLTYFNLPVSVHYSPLKNVSIGAGVQLSHLTNAVVRVEEKRFQGGQQLPDSGYSVKVRSIKKNDTLYQRIHTNELRLLGDVNYELGRFTLGVRYNQALKSIVKVPIAGSSLNQARNSSLQLYLRFRFLDKRKRIIPPLK